MMLTDPPAPFTLERVGTTPITFDGWLLASETSRTSPRRTRSDTKKRSVPADLPSRWTEIRLYRTVSDRWVAEVVGCSEYPDEIELRQVHVADTPAELYEHLRHPASGRVPGCGARALRNAAEADHDLEPLLVEHV